MNLNKLLIYRSGHKILNKIFKPLKWKLISNTIFNSSEVIIKYNIRYKYLYNLLQIDRQRIQNIS